MTNTPPLYRYRCIACGFAWLSDTPEEPRCPDCESGDIVMTSNRPKDTDD